jgi:thiol-disulfide isomerase/thioredoxin
MKNLSVIPIVLLLSLAGCGQSGTNVNGNLMNAEGEMVTLERLSSTKGIPVDSCEVDAEGNFKLNAGNEIEPGFYRLSIDAKNSVILLLENNEQAKVSGNALDFYRSYFIEGSEGSKSLRDLNLVLRSDFERSDSLKKVFQAHQQAGHLRLDSIAEVIDSVFLEMKANNRQFIIDLIEANPSSLVSLSAVQSLNPDVDFEVFQKVADRLDAAIPKSEYLKQYKVQLADIKGRNQASARTGIGAEAPEMIMQTPERKTIKLSDFRGNVTMIDFWASWCKPCRMENPNVVRVYNRFKDKGFEIFGVSLDQNDAQWVQAIAQDGLIWKHGSELKFWQSSFVPAYNLDGIPMTYLLDENGVIIAKGLRGEQLEQKLEELFN